MTSAIGTSSQRGSGPADHGAFADIRMFRQDPFDLGRIDVLPTGNDHVLLAVADPEIAVGSHRPISPVRYQPSCRASRVASALPQYSEKTLGPRTPISPGVPARHLAACMIDHLRFAAQAGEAGRSRARKIAAEPRIDRDGAGFRRTVDLKHRNAACDKTIDQMRRHDGRAGGDGLRLTRDLPWPGRDGRCTAWMIAGTITVSVGRSRAMAASAMSGVKRA